MGSQNCHCRANDLDSQFHLERGSEGTIRRHCDRALFGWRDFHGEFAVSEGLWRRCIDPSLVRRRSTVDHPVGIGVMRKGLERENRRNYLKQRVDCASGTANTLGQYRSIRDVGFVPQLVIERPSSIQRAFSGKL